MYFSTSDAVGGVSEAISQIASAGLLGALLVVCLVAYYLKDRQLDRERQEAQKLLAQERQEAQKQMAHERQEWQKRLNEETAARIKDGQETQKLLMDVQGTSINAIHKISDVLEWMEKRDEQPKRIP